MASGSEFSTLGRSCLDLKLKAWTLRISNFLLLLHHEIKLKRQYKLAQSLSEITNKNLHGNKNLIDNF